MELFETFDDEGRATGLVERALVHQQGLWHKSAHVFLFNSSGKLLIQKRAADKDLYGGLWDYSVGEHLTPGESHLQGALRGLHEELSIRGIELSELGSVRRIEHVGDYGADREIQQAFVGLWDGDVVADPVEIDDVAWEGREPLQHALAEAPHRFAPWFRDDVEALGIARDWDAIVDGLIQRAVSKGA